MLCLSIPTPGFLHYYYALGANLGSLLHGDVSVMNRMKTKIDLGCLKIRNIYGSIFRVFMTMIYAKDIHTLTNQGSNR